MPQHGRRVIANIDRLNACMDRNGLAAVAVRTGVNFTYLSGMAMPGTLARHLDIASTVRGFMVLWLRKGDPVVVLDAFAEKLARRESWIERVEVYQVCVPKTLSELLTLWNRLSWRNDRVVLFFAGRPGLAIQVEVAA
jgi:Xaa-Pro aminopeptidase